MSQEGRPRGAVASNLGAQESSMQRGEFVDLLRSFVQAHSPGGNEREMDGLVTSAFRRHADDVTQDPAGNIIAKVPGRNSGDPILVCTHKDEVGMIVKRIAEDGLIKLDAIGGSNAWVYGEGPVDILGDGEAVTGILSFGARHVSAESKGTHPGKDGRAPTWADAWVATKLSREALAERGVHVGSKAVIGRDRKHVIELPSGFVASYALDCKASLVIMVAVMEALSEAPPPRDICFIASAREEGGAIGAGYASAKLAADHMIAIEIAPAAREYDIVADPRPVLLYRDAFSIYDEETNRRLTRVADELGIELQRGVLSSFGSDASVSARQGHVAVANCICFPAENTHGYEIASLDAMENIAKILARFLGQAAQSS